MSRADCDIEQFHGKVSVAITAVFLKQVLQRSQVLRARVRFDIGKELLQ